MNINKLYLSVGNRFHWMPEGYQIVGAKVAEAIRRELRETTR